MAPCGVALGWLLGPHLAFEAALLLRPIVGEDLEGRAPTLQLHLPVEHHAGGHDDEVGAPAACVPRGGGFGFGEGGEEGTEGRFDGCLFLLVFF